MAEFTLWLVAVAIFQVLAAVAAFVATMIAAKAAKKSADVSERALVSLNRPFVHVYSYAWRWHGETVAQSSQSRYWYSIRPQLENAGTTPTRDMAVAIEWRALDSKLPDDFDFALSHTPGPAFLGPKGKAETTPATISGENLAAVQRGEKFFYLWGRIEYRDMFSKEPKPYVTRFCAQMVNVT